jgi:hypothetical protein
MLSLQYKLMSGGVSAGRPPFSPAKTDERNDKKSFHMRLHVCSVLGGNTARGHGVTVRVCDYRVCALRWQRLRLKNGLIAEYFCEFAEDSGVFFAIYFKFPGEQYLN